MTLLMLLSDGIATLAYALMADYTKAHFADNAARTAFYADLDLWINGFGALLQLSLTPLLLRGFGPLWALVLPSVVNLGLLLLLTLHGPSDVALFGIAVPLIVDRAGGHARDDLRHDQARRGCALHAHAARGALQGKNFIETAVWRFGDLVVTSGLTGLHAVGVGIAGIGLIGAGLAAVATEVARRAATSPDLEPESKDGA